MDYRELLNRCKTKPGWLGTKEQKEYEDRLKYRAWVDEFDRKAAKAPAKEPVKEPLKEPEKAGKKAQKEGRDFWSGKL